ncbi:amidase [Pseudomonas sp.]|uniref:amidase n=1 Tax=Pseudomonas sp. TaxID=306 RepID=UPI00258F7D08|nr:amidase [Pseudomonas sp.]
MESVLPHNPGFFHGASVVELGRRLRAGDVTCIELTQASLDSITKLNPYLNAFVHVDAQGALDQAAWADSELGAGRDHGPLHGIPIAIKDNIDTFDMPTTYGSAHFATHRPTKDAACVARLRAAGAIVVGKTLTHEFAFGPTGDRSAQGATHNPWDLSRMTGGSSAGSAAAVAAGLVPLAIGTDTGGSIRIPSGLCGAVGFKPGVGTVPMEGVFPLSKTLDHVGPIGNNLEDVAIAFSTISGQSDAEHAPVAGLRAGWIDVHSFGPADRLVTSSIKLQAQKLFGNLEVIQGIEDMIMPLRVAMADIQRREAYEVHAQRVAERPELFEAEVLERLRMSASVKEEAYVTALSARLELTAAITRYFDDFDVLVMPTLPITAPMLDQREVVIDGRMVSVRDAVLSLTSAWNITGLPAVSIPAGFVNGLPVGLQVIAAPDRDLWLIDQLRHCQRVAK